MKKFKLLFTCMSMTLAIIALSFGVYASIKQIEYKVGGTISYEVTNAYVKIQTKVYAYKTGVTDSNIGGEIMQEIKNQTISEIDARTDIEDTGYTTPIYYSDSTEVSAPNSIPLKYSDDDGYAYFIVINVQNLGDNEIYAIVSDVVPPPNSWSADSSGQGKILENEKNKNVVFAFGLFDETVSIAENSTFSYSIKCGVLEESEGLIYSADNTTVTGLDTSSFSGGVLIIPEKHNDINVTSVTGNFDDNLDITGVIFGQNVETMEGSFYLCYNLISAILPDSITPFGDVSVFYSTRLSSVTCPKNIKTLPNYCFSMEESGYDKYLSYIRLPDNVEEIGEEVIMSGKITSLMLPNTIKYIGSVDAPLWTNSLENGTATATDGITKYVIQVPQDVIEFDCANVKAIAGHAFLNCINIEKLIIPSSVVGVGEYAFNSWTNSQTIYVPFASGSIPTYWDDSWNLLCNANIIYQ